MKQLDLSMCFERKPPPIDFVFCGLPVEAVGNISSPGGAGKSFASLEIAIGVASAEADQSLLNLAGGKEGQTVIFSAEDSENSILNRLFAIGKHINPKVWGHVLANIDLNQLTERGNIDNPIFFDEVLKKSAGKRLVIFDTFNKLHELDENSNGHMSKIISCYEKLAYQTGAAVLFLHHSNKGSVHLGQQSEQQSTRGASAITDNCRWQGYLKAMSIDEAKKFEIAHSDRERFVKFGGNKENYGQATQERWLERCEGGVLLPSSRIIRRSSLTNKPNLKIVATGGSNDKII